MNGYDFDRTILKGNSMQRFAAYCALRLPYLWLLAPWMLVVVLLRGLHIISYDTFLRSVEVFVIFVPNRQKFVSRFWDKNIKHIRKWYLQAKRDDDIIISASPDFLINEICSRLGVRCITSISNKHGVIHQKHCYGQKKVECFQKEFGDIKLLSFYSDSMSDLPMFKLAEKGYYVKGEKITLVCQNGEVLPQYFKNK